MDKCSKCGKSVLVGNYLINDNNEIVCFACAQGIPKRDETRTKKIVKKFRSWKDMDAIAKINRLNLGTILVTVVWLIFGAIMVSQWGAAEKGTKVMWESIGFVWIVFGVIIWPVRLVLDVSINKIVRIPKILPEDGVRLIFYRISEHFKEPGTLRINAEDYLRSLYFLRFLDTPKMFIHLLNEKMIINYSLSSWVLKMPSEVYYSKIRKADFKKETNFFFIETMGQQFFAIEMNPKENAKELMLFLRDKGVPLSKEVQNFLTPPAPKKPQAKILDKSGRFIRKYVCSNCKKELDRNDMNKCPYCNSTF